MAPTECRFAIPEWRWDCRSSTPRKNTGQKTSQKQTCYKN